MGTVMPKVSVIIPVYNTEKYVERCLDSVCNQTLKDIEIICINDCSADNSFGILQEYAQKDSRIKLIDLKENKGAGFARNAGIDCAAGEYLAFVDSDDFLDLDFYEKLYAKAKECDADIVKGNRKVFELSGKVTIENLQEIIHKNADNKFYFSYQWTTAIYKRNIIKDNNIKLPEGTNCTEDVAFLIQILIKAKKVLFIDDAFYYYVRREISLNSSPMNIEKAKARLKSIEVILDVLNSTDENDLTRDEYSFLYKRYLTTVINDLIDIKESAVREIFINYAILFFYKCKHKNKIKVDMHLEPFIPLLEEGNIQKLHQKACDFHKTNKNNLILSVLHARVKRGNHA